MFKYLVIVLIMLTGFETVGQNKNDLYNIDVVINNLSVNTGVIKLEVVDNDGVVFKQLNVPVKKTSCQFVISDLLAGRYGIRYYHDENGNGQMDSYLVGIPKEGYGFSNNPYSRFGEPELEKILFDVKANTKTKIELETVNW